MFSSLRKSFAIVFLIAVYTLYLTLQGMQSVDRKEDVFLEMPHDWIPLKSPTDLAFYFQTDRVSRRMEFSIASVRRFFPEAPFYLLSDGGDLFTDVAAKWNVTAVHSAMRMHLAQYANENFTCQRHLLRLAEAARWAQDKGARYLMIWEEDTRMLRPVRGFPDADVITMGNIHNDHCGVFSPESMQRLEQKKEKDLAPGDLRRMRQRDRYTARQGFSAGPGSTWKIHSLLSALGTSKSEDLDELYQVQDLCWEDFALMTDQAVQRSPEVQQMLSPYGRGNMWPRPASTPRLARSSGDLDSQRPADPLRNLQCLWCLDSCKSSCGCTGLRWGVEWLQYLAVWLLWPLAPTFSIIEREKILWSRCRGRVWADDDLRFCAKLQALSMARRRCALMRWWLPTEIELHHYQQRSEEEFVKRRSYQMKGLEAAKQDFWRREEEEHLNDCEGARRILRFLPLMDSLKTLPWSERLQRFHAMGRDHQGTPRPHFITAVLEVNLFSTVEDEYLLEWIDFHTVAGMDHFVIYDARNVSSTGELLKDYVSNGVVELWPCRIDVDGNCVPVDELMTWNLKAKDLRGGSGGAQEEAFRAAAVKRIVQEVSTYWIAQLDLDEFMFPRQASSLRELLVPHTHQAGSVDMFFVWYLIFGSSGWHAKPPMRQIEAYRRCASARNWNGKSIAQADSIVLSGPGRYSGFSHKLIEESTGARVCDAHYLNWWGEVTCLENPVRLFDIVSVVLCLGIALLLLWPLLAAVWMLRCFSREEGLQGFKKH
ncbi:unnamed protein product [Durusdinium trenchii]|uniref:Glycosyltransferase family 92 protein n=1 Tax=Durusdinium trenchii TaxID=1381693 RepID=A0ABP0NNH8_9DINO